MPNLTDHGGAIPKEVTKASEQRMGVAYRRFGYMNSFLCCLYSAYSTVQLTGTQVQEPLDPTNYMQCAEDKDGVMQFYNGMDKRLSYPTERNLMQIECLHEALRTMTDCEVFFGDNYIDILTLIYLSCFQYSKHQFASAHLIAWSVVEKLIDKFWKSLQSEIDKDNGGHTAVNKDRRDLFNGRDYTASVVTQILSVANKISDEELNQLNKARKARNDFAHNLSPITSKSAGEAIRLSTELLTKLIGRRVNSQLSMSYWL